MNPQVSRRSEVSDINELAGVGLGSAGVSALVVGLLKWSGSRNINTLDDTLKSLNASVATLSKDVRDLREANIGLAKDIGSLMRRVDEQDKEIGTLRRHMHKLGNHLARLALKSGSGEHELGDDGDPEA